jgi:hypothetical protein
MNAVLEVIAWALFGLFMLWLIPIMLYFMVDVSRMVWEDLESELRLYKQRKEKK